MISFIQFNDYGRKANPTPFQQDASNEMWNEIGLYVLSFVDLQIIVYTFQESY